MTFRTPKYEIWKEIPGFVGYYCVSSHGRIKSLPRKIRRKGYASVLKEGGIIKPGIDKSGRPLVILAVRTKRKTVRVCRLILEAFSGPCPEGMEACHNDGNPANNSIGNLRWDTRKNNQRDRVRHGTDTSGHRNGRAKLTWDKVFKIRSEYEDGCLNQKQLAGKYEISYGILNKVVNNQLWIVDKGNE